MSSAPTRPVLRYHGGKWLLAPWIIEHFPPHRIYTEAFGGAGSVLARKPRSGAEVYNDLDGDVVGLFRVLRDPVARGQLVEAVSLTPFARVEFVAAYEDSADPVERARRLVVRSFMGFGTGGASGHRTAFRAKNMGSTVWPSHDWLGLPEALAAVGERFSGVVIEQEPATRLLARYDAPDALHYVDPPYPRGTRCMTGHYKDVYRHEMSDEDHRQLAATLHALIGAVVLSGYACDLYDTELYPDWKRIERAAHADGARDRTEVLWLNDAASRGLQPNLMPSTPTAGPCLPAWWATQNRPPRWRPSGTGLSLPLMR